jgi:hypothetical protein
MTMTNLSGLKDVVWKERLGPGQTVLDLPASSEIVHMGPDLEDQIAVWFRCDPDSDKRLFEFYVTATGQQVPTGVRHVGTFQANGLILHGWAR